jgi:MOSC domain-containing protein YiiM
VLVRVAAIFVGLPGSKTVRDGVIFTGGAKSAVESAFLRFDNLEGDGQGDLRRHGGRDRAVCVYIAEHYAWWKSAHALDLGYGAFCENLTVEGTREEEIYIGDQFRTGEALVQVALPRDPCRTLDLLTGIPGIWKLARDSGRCGFHMRALEEGLIRRGDALELVRRHPDGIPVSAVLDLYHGRSTDPELARRLSVMPDFAEQGKKDIAARLAGR